VPAESVVGAFPVIGVSRLAVVGEECTGTVVGVVGGKWSQVGNDAGDKGFYGIAVGRRVRATDDYAAAFGNETEAAGEAAFAVGGQNRASGVAAFASGHNTEAGGFGAMTMGKSTRAMGDASFAGGHGAVASNDECFVWAATVPSTNELLRPRRRELLRLCAGRRVDRAVQAVRGSRWVRPGAAAGSGRLFTLGGESYQIDPAAQPTWPGTSTSGMARRGARAICTGERVRIRQGQPCSY